MPPATLLALARRHRVALPADDEAGLRRWFRFRDFDHFVEIYLAISGCLRGAEDFHRLVLDVLAEQGRQNVVWTEAHFTVSTHLAAGGDGEGIRQAIAEAAAEGERRFEARLALIPDIVRNAPRERADWTVEWALGGPRAPAPGGVVALGIAGIEAGFPCEPFREHFDAAAAAGLHRVAHAGEHGGPDSVRVALDVLGAERIDHGVRAVEDPALVAELARRRIPLDVCPSSNLCLGIYPDLEAHPVDRLRRAGVGVNVGSDDPPLFGTTLTDEYLRLAAAFGYGREDIAGLALASIEHSFLPAEKESALLEAAECAAAGAPSGRGTP